MFCTAKEKEQLSALRKAIHSLLMDDEWDIALSLIRAYARQSWTKHFEHNNAIILEVFEHDPSWSYAPKKDATIDSLPEPDLVYWFVIRNTRTKRIAGIFPADMTYSFMNPKVWAKTVGVC